MNGGRAIMTNRVSRPAAALYAETARTRKPAQTVSIFVRASKGRKSAAAVEPERWEECVERGADREVLDRAAVVHCVGVLLGGGAESEAGHARGAHDADAVRGERPA